MLYAMQDFPFTAFYRKKTMLMRRVLYVILMMSALWSCSVEDSTGTSDIYCNDFSASGRTSFSGRWDVSPLSGFSSDATATFYADSVFITSMPCAHLFMLTLGGSGSAGEMPSSPDAWEMPRYAVRSVLMGNSPQMVVFGLDADDYTFRVRLADGWHTLSVRFAFDSGASLNRYTGTFTLWLSVRSVSVDGRVVASYDTERPVLTLISTL